MNERQCERCGKNITHKPHTIAEDVLGICSECAGDLDEFMNGAPIIKWNPLQHKKATVEKMAEHGWKVTEEEAAKLKIIDGLLPEDGEEVLVSTPDRVFKAIFKYATAEIWTDKKEEWDDVTAWAAMPEPYIPDKEEEEPWKE